MSYDIWLTIDTGGPEPVEVGESWNYTSNSGPAWRAAGADLADFDGKLAVDCARILDAAIETMRTEPARFKALDAPNGWGTYDTLVPALEKLRNTMRRHPKATVVVSR
jgi:hypothetical protein